MPDDAKLALLNADSLLQSKGFVASDRAKRLSAHAEPFAIVFFANFCRMRALG